MLLPVTAPLPLRTRLFQRIYERLVHEPTDAGEMAALRHRRDGVRTGPLGPLLFGRLADVEVSEVTVGLQRYVVHRPHGGSSTLPVVVNYHGGGWCLGSPEQSGWMTSHVAASVGAVVVSPTYRLAPEHPYPAAVDDAWAALEWVVAHGADLGVDVSRLAVMGDSAGGNLAAVVSLLAREAGAPAIKGQVLVYPATEMYETFPSEAANAHGPVLTSTMMHTFARQYLGEGYGDKDWRISPLRADSHADLPPAYVVVAAYDPIHDHGTRYADALRAASTPVEVADHATAFHGFMSLPGVAPAARPALDGIAGFLRRVL